MFLSTVAHVWSDSPPLYHSRVALSLFHKKLKQLKAHLRELNRTQFGELTRQTKEAYESFCSMQTAAFLDPSLPNVVALSVASENWHRLSSLEEKFFQQKSRIQWLSCGDQKLPIFIVLPKLMHPTTQFGVSH